MSLYNFPTIFTRECGEAGTSTGGGGNDGGSSGSVCCGLVIANSLAALRATPDITGVGAAMLFSVNSPGDSSPIFYWWEATSLDVDDGLSTVKFDVTPAGSPGRLKQSGINAP